MASKTIQVTKYVVADFLSAMLAWVLFFVFRKVSIEQAVFTDMNAVFEDSNLIKGIIFIPVFWLFLYYVQGCYQKIFHRSRLKDLLQTIVISTIGVILLFFAFLLDDNVSTYKNYYFSFSILLLLHFVLTYLPRLIFTTITVKKVHKGEIYYPTLLIVSDCDKALQCYNDIQNQEISSGIKFVGYITLDGYPCPQMKEPLQCLGSLKDLQTIIDEKSIEEVFIVLKKEDENRIYDIIFSIQKSEVEMYIPSDRKDLLTGSIKLRAIFSVPLVRISQEQMEPWEFALKRAFDIFVAIVAMIILIPVYLVTAIIVKATSKGPIIFKQERIGKHGKPFKMYKFRSMYVDAEKGTPMLSSGDEDPRITKFGRFMRKVRLDETPQFFNVLIGNMSMVGPRPERQYYIDQIVQKAPEYKLLHKIKPGMTSWGQVKFGYADTIDQMVERLKYDLLYLENMSMVTDIKILLYTFIIILQGRGK
ncbi:MAG: sugar transferase [Bacteroidales bacterium]|nr:sugar transferase [Candidatus Scybalousia scybalohippi]MCQ2327253.1 sugar transferase [Bacteroidales bacterium]